ncbi:hypothetical protein M407DRAFT_208842 [Tulasnella calospora MUT 4182]|uniref:Uncharacterized protein n=1 Tax=Tulasnella calospora MUT 4182 TaxID=1051891 RepID=A0A0C3KVP1_9AGAM|nr:hypothetical protein M407DRAFT_208842 [Tulasnella calospora MUT 4182]
MLVPLIGTTALTPHLDLDRQRRNMMKRFDWSTPSASESSALEDSGRPDWTAYETAVARLKGREDGERNSRQSALFVAAREGFVTLRDRVGDQTNSSLCRELWVEFMSGMVQTCNKFIRTSRASSETGEVDHEEDYVHGEATARRRQYDHPWFPDTDKFH